MISQSSRLSHSFAVSLALVGFAITLVSLSVGCETVGQRACNQVTDCTTGQQCVRGACQQVTAASHCTQDTECSLGQVCKAGQCQATGTAGVCQPGAQTCDKNLLTRCKADGSGWTSIPCGAFHECQQNQCVRKPPPPLCGNGVLDNDEQCDDGNNRSGDGCSLYCLRERVMLFEPPAESRDLSPFILGSRTCRSTTKRNSYKNDTTPLYITIVPVVCKLNDRPVTSEQTIKSHIIYLNKVYANARLVFVMDPIQWETDKDHCEVFYDTESSAVLRRYTQSTKIAVFYARNIYGGSFSIGGYANLSGVVLNASAFGVADILAHELGHSFGLDHPHACYHGKETSQNCSTAGDQLCDTPPDPGPRGVNGLDHCPDGSRKDGQCTVTRCRSISCPNGEKPQFTNLMSYYHCGTALTAEQLLTLRCVAFNEQARRVSKKRPCRSNTDCPSNQRCESGFCEATPGCTSHDQCPRRQYCNNGQCANLATGECRRDTDCAGGEVCRNGRCYAPPECRTNNDCPSGQVCQDGSCKPAPLPECQQDSDCVTRKYCDNGVCKDLPTGSCRSHSDCANGEICQAQKCIPRPPPSCQQDSDCQTNQVCRNRQCVSCTPDGQSASSNTACCSGERNDRGQCCTERACCGPQNHSSFNSNGQCTCNTGYEWLNPNASRDFRCKPTQGTTCKKDWETASSDDQCCSKERNDISQCCTGKSCCGPKHHSSTQSNGNCQCDTGYTWENPSDQLDFRCKKNTPSCVQDGQSASTASQCCSNTRDDRGLCCSGNSCCHGANHAQSDGQGGCQCVSGYVRINPNDPNDLRCQSSQSCPHCCTLLRTLTGHSKLIRGVAVSPDGKIVVSGSYDNTVKVWDVATGKLLHTLTGPSNAVMSVAIHPNGSEIAAGSYDKSYRRWRLTGQSISSSQLFAPIRAVAYRPDGQQIVTGTEQGAYLWSLANGGGAGFAGSAYVRGAAFSPDSRLVALATRDKTVHLYQTSNNQLLRNFTGHVGHVFDVSFSSNGKELASSSSSLKRWDLTTGRLLSSYNGHNRGIYAVKYNPRTGILFSGGEDNNINIWSPTSGQVLQTLTGHTGPVYTLSFSNDGKILASGSKDNSVKLWSCQ